MKVHELIDKLKDLPQDLQVICTGSGWGVGRAESVHVERDHWYCLLWEINPGHKLPLYYVEHELDPNDKEYGWKVDEMENTGKEDVVVIS